MIDFKDPSDLLEKLKLFSPREQMQLLRHLETLASRKENVVAEGDFIEFVKLMWPDFILGRHHHIIANAFQRVANGSLKRLIINLPPRHSKSELSSFLFPAWFLGQYPKKKIIQASNNAELAVRFGRKVRDLVDTPDYQSVFPGTKLSASSKANFRWNTSAGGEYFAIGTGGKITGRGADLYIIDDPHSEQEALLAQHDPSIFDDVYEWYTSGPRQRLQPGAAIIIIMTRWGARDLTGQVLKTSASKGGNEWEVIELPAILPSGNPLWPEFWPLEELVALREELPLHKWMSQYQQKPTSDATSIVKPTHWKIWKEPKLPACDYIIQSWDTALLTTERSNNSACTTWGVFFPDEDKTKPNIILLEGYEEKMEFIRLKKQAMISYKAWRPDTLVIETKAAGSPLIFELRAMGLPVLEYTPTRGKTKLARVNAVADLFTSGVVWAQENAMSEKVINQFAEFPYGDSDDLVDSSTQALIRFRQGGFIRLASDELEEDAPKGGPAPEYY
jgi:predicted phage terminase large subunit-like protein